MSTRRARIKAVAALPPRRKNVETVDGKKKQEEKKEDGYETKTSKDQESVDNTARQTKKSFESPSKRRLSLDKSAPEQAKKCPQSPMKRRMSVDKSALDQAKKCLPMQRRISVDKSAPDQAKKCLQSPMQLRMSVDKSVPDQAKKYLQSPMQRRMSVDKSVPDQTKKYLQSPMKRRMSVGRSKVSEDWRKTPRSRRSSTVESPRVHNQSDKTPKQSPSAEKSGPNVAQKEQADKAATGENCATEDASESPSKSTKNFVSNHILKGLLNAAEKPPRNVQLNTSLTRSMDNLAKDQDKSDDKSKGNQSDSDKEIKRPSAVPFFASPLGRASPRRPSPIVRTPIIEVDLIAEKCIAPHKGPNSVSRENNYLKKHAEDVSKGFGSKEVEVIIEKVIDADELKKMNDPKDSDETSTVMDGIVPLQSASKAPKPLDLLKNEIISENAVVLFDPIVPLPSPSKVRQKLRPAPRLGPRRNSFQQGSASESEDDNRRHARPSTPAIPLQARQRNDSHTSSGIMLRGVARVRNDSICSSVSQTPSQAAVGSPKREKVHNSKARREEMTARRNAAMRKREQDVEREKLTMYDLIFYNPKDNPIIPDQDEIDAKQANKKEEDRIAEAMKPGSAMDVDEPEPSTAPVAVPQIKLGPNGEIVLDEQSLVVNQSDQRKIATSVVREGAWGSAASRAYRRTPRSAAWTDAETVRFYRALAAMGTDFSLMQPLFPDRTRRDIKLKFKKEERVNLAQVDMALRSRSEFDPIRLEKEFTEERKLAMEEEKKAKEKLEKEKILERERERERRRLGVRQSRCAKTLGDSSMPHTFAQGRKTPSTLDEYVQFQEERKRKANQKKAKKKRKPVEEFAPATITSMKVVRVPELPPPPPPESTLATLTMVPKNFQNKTITEKKTPNTADRAIITRDVSLPLPKKCQHNTANGSLVLLSVDDPQSPSRKMLQLYLSQGPGNMAPASVKSELLSSVLNYIKTCNPNATFGRIDNLAITNGETPTENQSSYNITQL